MWWCWISIQIIVEKWSDYLANKIHNLANTPRDSWKIVTTFRDEFKVIISQLILLDLKIKMVFF